MSIIYHVLLLNLWDPTPKSLGSNSKPFKISTPPPTQRSPALTRWDLVKLQNSPLRLI